MAPALSDDECGPLTMTTEFSTIIIDPPWQVKRPNGWGRKDLNHLDQPYPTLTTDMILRLPVAKLATDTAYLFVWTVNKFIEDTYKIVKAWDFTPTMLLTWCKPPIGMGPGGHFASTTEFILYARRGSSSDFGRTRIHSSSWFDWPRGRQSEKPEAFQDLIERHFPGPFLEMFARRCRLGWTTWGNEVPDIPEIAATLPM